MPRQLTKKRPWRWRAARADAFEHPKRLGEFLLERCHGHRPPVAAEVDVEPHASNPDLFVVSEVEPAQKSRRDEVVILILEDHIEHIRGKADVGRELILRAESGRPAPPGIVERVPLESEPDLVAY